MSWTEQNSKSREVSKATDDRARLFDEVKKELPVIQKEAEAGSRPFDPVKFQPIMGVGIFEAEFGVKGEDVLFHFWPWEYHEAERTGRNLPRFKPGFEQLLREAFEENFRNVKIEVTNDIDVGAWFLKVPGGTSFQFHRDMSVKSVTSLYLKLGGVLSEG